MRIEPRVDKPTHPVAQEPLSERAAQFIVQATRLTAQQRFTEAAMKLERALRYEPNHPEIHRVLAWLHWRAGNVERAKTHAARALEVNPDMAAAQFIMGRCHSFAQERTAAIQAYRTALLCSDFQRDPETAALTHYYLAEALNEEEYLQAAVGQYDAFESRLQDLDESTANRPSDTPSRKPPTPLVFRPAALEAKSQALERLGRFADAAEALHPLLAGGSDEITIGIRRARLLLRADQPEDALRAARAIPSDDEEVFILLLEIHEQAGQPQGMIDELRERIAARPRDVRLRLRLANVLTRVNRPEEAQRELAGYLEIDPEAQRVRERLLSALIARSAWNDALKVCAAGMALKAQQPRILEEKILSLANKPAAVDALLDASPDAEDFIKAYLRGALASAAHRLEQAEIWLRRSLEDDPSFIPARIALARVYLETYRYQDVIRVARRSDDEAPLEARLELALGDVYERLDDLEQAERHLKAAIQLDRADTQAMFLLARIYENSRRINLALQQLRVLLGQDPRHEQARERIAMIYMGEGKPDVALEHLEELKRITDNPGTIARCEALLDPQLRHDPEARRQHLMDAIARHQPDAATWTAIAGTYNEFQAAAVRDAYLEAIKLEPDHEGAAYGLVRSYQRLLNYEEAGKGMEALLRLRPNRHRWRLAWIEIQAILLADEGALSIARAQEARSGLDERWRHRYRLAMLDALRRMDRQEEVFDYLKTWAQEETDAGPWLERLGQEYLRQEQFADAVAVYEGLYKAKPEDWSGLGKLLNALSLAGRYERAAQYALDRLEDDPENDTGIWMLAALLAQADHLDDALELARNRLLRTAKREAFQDFISERLQAAGRHDENLDYVETLIDEAMALSRVFHQDRGRQRIERVGPRRASHRPDEPFSLGRLKQRLGRLQLHMALGLIGAKEFHRAESLVAEWLEGARDPTDRARYLRLLATSQRQRGDENRASESLQRALLLQSDDPLLNNDVAYGWIDLGVRLEEAESMIRYAVWRRPRQAAYLDTYGWLMYKQSRFTEAKKWLQRARHALRREDPVIQDHLGDASWRLGQTDEAIEHWEAAVRISEQREESEVVSEDEQRMREASPGKIEDARAGRDPAVAPLASGETEALEADQ